MDNKDLEQLKNQIGFKTAFKATMGFYAAQTLATFIGLGTFAAIVGVSALLFKSCK